MKQAQFQGLFEHLYRSVKNGLPYFGLPAKQVATLFNALRGQEFESAYKRLRVFAENASGRQLSDPTRLIEDLDDRRNSVGIFSLAKAPDNDLMWAHYGSEHRGLCLGFGVVPGTPLADPERCFPVRYSTTLPAFSPDGFISEVQVYGDGQTQVGVSFSDPTFRAAISTKSPSWAYEREWRYVERRGGDYEWPGPIREVTFGLRCTAERRTYYLDLIAEYVAGEVQIYVVEKIQHTNALSRTLLRTIHGKGQAETLREQGQVIRLGTARTVGAHIDRLLKQGAYDEAIESLNHQLSEHGEEMHLLFQKATALGLSGRHEQALKIYESLSEQHSVDNTVWFQRGVALTALKRIPEAIVAYRRANALDASDASTNFNLGCLLIQSGKSDEARAYLKVAASQGHPRAHGVIESYCGGEHKLPRRAGVRRQRRAPSLMRKGKRWGGEKGGRKKS